MIEFLIAWAVCGAMAHNVIVTLWHDAPPTDREWWIVTITGGPSVWLAIAVVWCVDEYDFWKNTRP